METQITVLEIGTKVEITPFEQICGRECEIVRFSIKSDKAGHRSIHYTVRDNTEDGDTWEVYPQYDEIRVITDEGPECYNCERVLDECRCSEAIRDRIPPYGREST